MCVRVFVCVCVCVCVRACEFMRVFECASVCACRCARASEECVLWRHYSATYSTGTHAYSTGHYSATYSTGTLAYSGGTIALPYSRGTHAYSTGHYRATLGLPAELSSARRHARECPRAPEYASETGSALTHVRLRRLYVSALRRTKGRPDRTKAKQSKSLRSVRPFVRSRRAGGRAGGRKGAAPT